MADHKDLPAAYLASCEKFFKSIKQQAPSGKQSCNPDGWPSTKRQAPSNKRLTGPGSYVINRIIKEK